MKKILCFMFFVLILFFSIFSASELDELASGLYEIRARVLEYIMTHAAEKGGIKIDEVKRLVEQEGVNPSAKGKFGNSALHWASVKGNVELSKYLLEKDANPDSVNNDGFYVIHYAVLSEKKKKIPIILKLLLEAGVNLSVTDREGKTAFEVDKEPFLKIFSEKLIQATRSGKVEDVKEIFAEASSIGCKEEDFINRGDEKGATPVFHAAAISNFQILDLLLSKGANIDLQDNEGRTPLYWVAADGKVKIVDYLLKKGADRNILTNDNKAPYEIAEEMHNIYKSEKYKTVMKLLVA